MTAYIFIYLGFTEAYKKFFLIAKTTFWFLKKSAKKVIETAKVITNSDIKIIDSTVFVSWISSFKISL